MREKTYKKRIKTIIKGIGQGWATSLVGGPDFMKKFVGGPD